MNTQDSDEDALLRQQKGYPERGAGGFSSIRRADGGEHRASPPVQTPEELRRPLGSELAPEQGRSLLRRSPEDRFGAGLKAEAAEAAVGN
jgi:hypothetical protein